MSTAAPICRWQSGRYEHSARSCPLRRFRFLRDPDASLAGASNEDFLRELGGPACLFFTGRDTQRTRALVTLLHGNEPSGLFAVRRWLLAQQQPAVNLLVIVASVHAARAAPPFSHRMLPGVRDLNRCFQPPYGDEQGKTAEEILEILNLHHPEAVVDMHNTSGSGPAFGVCSFADRHHDALVSLFTHRLVVSGLQLGALMETSNPRSPTVTIELGGRADEAAHALAHAGLLRYAMASEVLTPTGDAAGSAPPPLEIFDHPMRLELAEGVVLGFGAAPQAGCDITLRADIERLNFGTVDAGTPLGWVSGNPHALLRARDASGNCVVSSLVQSVDGELMPARDLKLFMITNNAAIAASDCLLYAVYHESSS